MTGLWSETRREWRWARSSRLLLLVIAAAAVFAVWSAISDLSNASSAAAQFARTASSYQQNGQSVADSLAAPLHVTQGEGGQRTIDNPLRYDYEAYVAAASALNPMTAALTALSLAAFVLLPLVGYVLGVLVATHDLRSGSIIVRWPASHGALRITSAKVLTLAALVAAIIAAVAVSAAVLGLFSPLWRPELPGFAAAITSARQPAAWTLPMLGVVLILIGTGFASLGLLVGSITRERAFTILLFALPFFLLPIIGVWDPRNLIPAAGHDLYQFLGEFHPQVTGALGAPAAMITLIVATLAMALGGGVLWAVRDKTPRSSTP